tara:strand:- start:44 stop:790 length:747 start_codon:yes stop_codon:yes gene_type:complete
LQCGDADFHELNCAQQRGIDMVREIQSRVGFAPMDGKARVWLIDEAHQLTADAQGAFLKLLEEPPEHVYFMLATTNPEKLKKTIRTRCTEIKVRALSPGELTAMCSSINEEHTGEALTPGVGEALVGLAEGSARKALVLLQQIIAIEGDEARLAILERGEANAEAIQIARGLMNPRTTWAAMAKVLKGVTEEPEGLRWMVLSYAASVLLGGGKGAGRAAIIIEEFSENYFDTKRAGLVLSCYNVIHPE